jgi:hypothetical protein
MVVVVALVVHSRRAFLGSAAMGVVGDVGAEVTGHRGPSVAAPK